MFEYAAKNLRTWAGVIRPHFEGERTPLYADDPDNAPEQLESAARFLELAGKLSEHERLYLFDEVGECRWRDEVDPEDLELASEAQRAAVAARLGAWDKLRALLEALPEGEKP